MAILADHGTPTAPDAAPEAAPAPAAPEAAHAGTASGPEAPALELDTTVPDWEPTGQLAGAPPELASKIAEAVNAHSEGVLAAKLKDMKAGYYRQIQKLADTAKAAQREPEIDPELQANAEAYLALLEDPDGIHALSARLRGESKQEQAPDLAGKFLARLQSEGFDEEVGGSLARVLAEVAAELKGSGDSSALAAEVKAIKAEQARRDAEAAQAAQLQHFEGLQTGWDTELGLAKGTAAEVFGTASQEASPEKAARSLLLGRLLESGKLPVGAIPEGVRAAIVKADQDRIFAATHGTTSVALAPGASPAAPPGKPAWDPDAPPGANHARAKQILAERRRGR